MWLERNSVNREKRKIQENTREFERWMVVSSEKNNDYHQTDLWLRSLSTSVDPSSKKFKTPWLNAKFFKVCIYQWLEMLENMRQETCEGRDLQIQWEHYDQLSLLRTFANMVNVRLVFHTVTRVTRNREEKTRVVIQDFLLVFTMFLLFYYE